MDEKEEIFHECEKPFPTEDEFVKPMDDGINSNHLILANETDKEINVLYEAESKRSNNNHYVVYVGVIVVVLTIYLGMTNVRKSVVSCVENTPITEQVEQHKAEILNYLQKTEQLQDTLIIERLLEYKDICKDMEIFTKDVKQKLYEKKEKKQEKSNNGQDCTNDMLKNNEIRSGPIHQVNNVQPDYSGSGSTDNADCAKEARFKNKNSKHTIKTSSNKNGFHKFNKSVKVKNHKNEKKDLNLNKKNSTAEPIIYLFALVFLYLLLKAASDINQHYKSQNKNDKRLRRCSLQSYAQTHRPDRRASKATGNLGSKQKQLQPRFKSLCSIQNQQIYRYNHKQQEQQQKYCKRKQQATTVSPTLSIISNASNRQLLRQHKTTQSVDNSDIAHSARDGTEITSPMMARRCSVPVALNYPKQAFATSSPLNSVNDQCNASVSLGRRNSITASTIQLVPDPNSILIPEIKRRVRMINRH